MRKLIVAAVLALGSVPLTVQPSFACSCVPPKEGQTEREYRHEAARDADVVFTGRVWRVERADDGFGSDEAHFFVEEAYKGTRRHRVTVSSSAQGSMCGFHFNRGTRYTVFGYGKGPRRFHTHLCTETQRGWINPDRYGL